VAELYEPVAEQAGLQLQMSSREGLCICANRELVGQALANLVDNAIKYSTPAAQAANAHETAPPVVSIALEQIGDNIEIATGDRGPGIAAEDRLRALQRFVRLEKSRSLPGSGLGLSLVAAVARLHGGSIRLEDNQPGLKAVLSFPACSPAGGRETSVPETASPVHA
jgi:signal transduction histidine kinase